VLLPDLLGTYGDRGNAIVLAHRAKARSLAVEVLNVGAGQGIPNDCDIYVLGGGEDLAQNEATDQLRRGGAFPRAVQRGRVVLAVCAGLQILGRWTRSTDGTIQDGLGLLDVTTQPLPRRAIGEVLTGPNDLLRLSLLTGFENHRGGTRLGAAAAPLGAVVRGHGNGDGTEGAVQGHIVGSYLHGPVLARNPDLADLLLSWAVGAPLEPIDVPAVAELRQARIRAARHRRWWHLSESLSAHYGREASRR
jgi:CobQ-like glutamine amidotransferase family enzyme